MQKIFTMNSFTKENYLKAIFTLLEKEQVEVSTNAIAEQMNTKPASVTDMLKKLAEKKLINYQKYQGVTLTALGTEKALAIIRKHRLWEVFLVEKLNFKWDEVHDIAEELEHINSKELVERLDKFLNCPKYDPHGDPIPDSNGKLQHQDCKTLAQMATNTNCIMTGIIDHSSVFLKHLNNLEIALGIEIKIKEIVAYDKALYIKINNGKELYISNLIAQNILVIEK